MSDDPAEHLKARLRADLPVALRARDAAAVRALRGLLAALDDAQAVPVGGLHDRYEVRAFGDPSNEVPRLRLDADAVADLVARERAARRQAADELDRLGQGERAADLRAEADALDRYAPG